LGIFAELYYLENNNSDVAKTDFLNTLPFLNLS
jgi:hypothetical protein